MALSRGISWSCWIGLLIVMNYPARELWFLDLSSRLLQCAAFAVAVIAWALFWARQRGASVDEMRSHVLAHTLLGGTFFLGFAAIGEYLQGFEGRHAAFGDFAMNGLTIIAVCGVAIFLLSPPRMQEEDLGRGIHIHS
jgi:hypothetical protein